MATITVTNLNDSGAGSLRNALSTASSGDTIQFAPNLADGTLVLTNGELDITKNVTINGDIDGNTSPDITIDAGGASRVFNEDGAFGLFATLNGLVISDGSAPSGGGIRTGTADNLFLNNSQVTNNQASALGGGIYGGPGGELVLFNTTVSGNTSGSGGGIYANSTLTMTNATISGNSSTNTGGGIGLAYNATGTLKNTTLTGNSSGDKGGAIYGHTSQIRLYDSTVTGNYAGAKGGAIYNLGGTPGIPLVLLSNSIVAGNAAPVSGPDLDLNNSPLYVNGNNILGSAPANVSAIHPPGATYTQIDGTDQTQLETVFAVVGNNPDTGVLSGLLAKNGGPVQTVAINPTNPPGIAYNAGDNAAVPPGVSSDARGFMRVAGGTVDIGAFEQQPNAPFIVTTLADETYDGNTLAQETADGTGLSLREALGLASASPGSHKIIFAPSLTGGTIYLANGELDVTSDVTIDGDVNHNGTPGITIDGSYASRVFAVDDGLPSTIVATLDGLVIRDGDAGPLSSGGGIAVGELDILTLENSKVTSNAGYSGGGIYGAQGSAISLINTSVSGNSSDHAGGGIYVGNSATLALINATVSSNYSATTGGGIDLGTNANATLTNATIVGNTSYLGDGGGINGEGSNVIKLYNSTLTGNYAYVSGGGIYTGSGSSLTLANSIVAGNAAYGSGNDLSLDNSPLVLQGNNILGSTPANASAIDTSNGTYTQIDGGDRAALETVFARVAHNPHTGVLSGVLGDNGGPLKTVAINPFGIAHDAGSNAALPPDSSDLNNNTNTTEPLPVDARGFARVSGASVDIGAFEQQPGTSFVVTTLADETYDGGMLAQKTADGSGLSLREALGLANQDRTSTYRIVFAPNLIGGSTHGVNDGALLLTNGQLIVNGNVTIEGDINGDTASDITIDAQGASRDFDVLGGNVTLDGLTITGGYAYVHGGGVSLGTGANGPAYVSISHSVITNNQSAYGGGISITPGDALSLTNSLISGNSALYVGGGIANEGELQMRDVTVSGNSSGYIGGGIANAGLLVAINSTLANNQVTNPVAGAFYASAGGGLYNVGIAALVNTTVSGNKGAYLGGGVYNEGGLLLTNATIANNSAYNGGGLSNAPCGCGYATVNDSTFTGNYAKQFGGGIYNPAGTVALTNSLVAGNNAGYHGPDILTASSGSTNYYGVNLFSQAGAGRPGTDIVQPDLTQVFASLATIDPDGVPNSGDEFQAGTLANNGGSVQTVAIKVGGSAQDAGSTADLPPDIFDINNNGDSGEPLPVDARGVARVSGPAVDIGAFEVQVLPPPPPQPSLPFDLNGDANSDLVFQNNGAPGIWLMNGANPIAEVGFANPGASWHVITSRDVDGDRNSDLIWQNSDGTPGIWLMNGTTPIAQVGLTNPGANWHLVAAGDLNADGKADLIWQETGGTLGVWLMNGTTPVAQAGIGNPGAAWKVIGAADFNADGRDDILLQNTTTGDLMVDLMNGASIASTVSIAAGGPSWHAVSVREFNGQAEIAWQNSDGTPGIWLMNGTTPVAEAALPNPGAGWRLVSIDHFTPNGQPDLLFQNGNDALQLWEMNGTSVANMVNPPNPGAGWQSANGHPFATG
jgi:predicted outer membrane repeat protein